MVATESSQPAGKLSRLDLIKRIAQSHLKKTVPAFRPGDTVRVLIKIIEGDRARLQPFEGIVIARRGAGISETFTVRRVSYGEGVEKVFPLHAPTVDKIEVLKRGNVKRAKLYYLRRQVTQKVDEIDPSALRSQEKAAAASGKQSVAAKAEPAAKAEEAAAPAAAEKPVKKSKTPAAR